MYLKNPTVIMLILVFLAAPAVAKPKPLVVESGNQRYNCHGLTFHRGHFEGDQDKTVNLVKSGYTKIDKKDAKPGDIIVYDGKAVSHTGLVIGDDGKGNLLVISKFGTTGDLKVHTPGQYGNAKAKDWDIHRHNGHQGGCKLDKATLSELDTFRKALKFKNWPLARIYAKKLAAKLGVFHDRGLNRREVEPKVSRRPLDRQQGFLGVRTPTGVPVHYTTGGFGGCTY